MYFDSVVARSLDVIEEREVEEVIKTLKNIFENGVLKQYIEIVASEP